MDQSSGNWYNVGDPLYFPTLLCDCLCHVWFRRYLPLSLKVVKKYWANVKVFFCSWKGQPQLFYGRLLALVYHLAQFGWVPFADPRLQSWQWSRTQNLRRVGKNDHPILSHLPTKVHNIFRWRRRPLVVSNALARLHIPYFIWKV